MNKRSILSLFLACFVAIPLLGTAGTAINFQNATFNSHGDFIYCGQPDYAFTDKLTVAVWIKWTTDPGAFARSKATHDEREGNYATYMAYAEHNATNVNTDEEGQFWLRTAKTGNKFEFTVENASGTKVTAVSTTKPVSGTWYYVVGTYDGSNLRLYINGIQEGGDVGLTGNIRGNTDCRLTMGKLPWGYGLYVGYLDEVRIWNAALSQAEIQSQMNSKSTVRDADCKSYWNFDAGSGTAITDSKGLANGTFYTALIDVHSYSAGPPVTISDDDRAFVTNVWNGKTMKTVAGAGVDATNTIVSNTDNVFTLSSACATPPVLDGTANMTWFGVLDPAETSQWVSASDVPLPICLKRFSAAYDNGSVQLTWETASETENLAFRIYRNDEMIAVIDGAGTTSEPHSYVYTDQYVIPGRTYSYVLSDVDYQGKETKHPEIKVEVKVEGVDLDYTIGNAYPNPFNPVTVVPLNLAKDAPVRALLYDVRGYVVKELMNGSLSAGSHALKIDGSALSTGIYFVHINVNNAVNVQKIALMK